YQSYIYRRPRVPANQPALLHTIPEQSRASEARLNRPPVATSILFIPAIERIPYARANITIPATCTTCGKCQNHIHINHPSLAPGGWLPFLLYLAGSDTSRGT